MTRAEHLQWAKDRALAELDAGRPRDAVVSMLSDLRKHPELDGHSGGTLGAMLLVGGFLGRDREIREWIEGFN